MNNVISGNLTFDEWFEQNYKNLLSELCTGDVAKIAWETAQQVERKRMITILYEVCKYRENFDLIIEKMYE